MSNQFEPSKLPERNPLTHAQHRREIFWQVTFPLIIGGLLLLAGIIALTLMTINEVGLARTMTETEVTTIIGDVTAEEAAIVYYQRGMTSRLASISQIWLVLPVLLFSLLIMGIFAGLAVLSTKLLGILPGYMRIVQNTIALVDLRTRKALDVVVEPILKAKGLSAAVFQAKQMFYGGLSDLKVKINRNHDG